MNEYHQAAATVATFVRGIDFTDFVPVPCELSSGLKGAVLGNQRLRLAWFRDAECGPPDWPMKLLSGQRTSMEAPGASWQVKFVDPVTGGSTGKTRISVRDRRVRVAFGEFQGSVALQLKRLDP